MPNADWLLDIKGLKTYFFMDQGTVKAVDGVDLTLFRGRTLGIVGESGCGKSITARSILQIVDTPGRLVAGEVLYRRTLPTNGTGAQIEEIDLARLKATGREIRAIRGKEISMIFQEPMTSLSGLYTIGNQIMENLLLHQKMSKTEARERAIELLRQVGIAKPEQRVDEYPHQFSGGMRQRAMIAMAIACNPSLLIADEPTTALDVTTQAQILRLIRSMQRRLGMSLMLITHDLGVVAGMCTDVAVMYLGRVVETADVNSIFHDPKHPYTQALLRSIPKVGGAVRQRLDSIEGMVPDPFTRPSGCYFHPRCIRYMPGVCDRETPQPVQLGPGRMVSCLLYGQPDEVAARQARSMGAE
jgi:oligopeptide/dipeptide ABC transporter ATP-binding protein